LRYYAERLPLTGPAICSLALTLLALTLLALPAKSLILKFLTSRNPDDYPDTDCYEEGRDR
jgi:hypothetical protein